MRAHLSGGIRSQAAPGAWATELAKERVPALALEMEMEMEMERERERGRCNYANSHCWKCRFA